MRGGSSVRLQLRLGKAFASTVRVNVRVRVVNMRREGALTVGSGITKGIAVYVKKRCLAPEKKV